MIKLNESNSRTVFDKSDRTTYELESTTECELFFKEGKSLDITCEGKFIQTFYEGSSLTFESIDNYGGNKVNMKLGNSRIMFYNCKVQVTLTNEELANIEKRTNIKFVIKEK